MPEFVHLHNHTHYSLLDSTTRPEQLINAAVADGHKAIALTDHGVMFGCFEFYTKARQAGIKPLLGFEAYVANGSRFDTSAGKSGTKKKNYFHLVLLAKNLQGYKNLLKLTSLAHTEGFYYKPRVDRELLEKYSEGVIATSACIAGVINAHLINNDYQTAYDTAKYYKDLYGEDFYVELQNHNLPDDKIILRDAPKIAKELDIKLIATNDIHYLAGDHAIAHNVLLYIRDITAATAGTVDIRKLRYRTPEMYFKTKDQMLALFPEFPEALDNTVEIADKCDVVLDDKLYMPQFDIPPTSKAKDLAEYLGELTYEGLSKKYNPIPDEVRERTDFELAVINNMGFPGYFLIVQDFIKAAQKLDVRVGPGRGSAAGSMVAYGLGITNVDPIKYDLLFERFLNPDRISMPDIDIDFADDKRDRVLDYVKQKYGESSVAQIITFGQLSSRAVLTDVGRVLGVELLKIKEITSKIPVVQGKVTKIAEAIELPELAWLKQTNDEQIKELINFALLLEGVYRNTSTHAAGVVIAPGDISNYVPIYKQSKNKGQSVEIITQYAMNDLEPAGLVKMDFLGLRTLSIIENTLALIEKNYDTVIDIEAIDLNDTKTYDLLSNGDTLAVFQFESRGMQEYLKQLKPRSLEELTAMNALYRPGPMDNIPEFIDRKYGRKPIDYLHPLMENSLKTTYGIIVYQEQVMQLVRDLGGFSLGQADILRRAMGKKKQSEMDKMHPLFIQGAAERGIDSALADEIYKMIEKFANYGFNKSHSLAYSYLAFQTAWLKAHYPAEFLAANMTAELTNQEKIVALMEEGKKYGITVLPPDVNKSFAEFYPYENNIVFGLAAIKNVGVGAVESIIKAREEHPFDSLFDFMLRVDAKTANKRALEAMIYSGAFDYMGKNRPTLLASLDSAIDYAKSLQGSQNSSMDSLFGGSAPVAVVEPKYSEMDPWPEREMLQKEKEYLGFYVTGHPLNFYKPYTDSFSTAKLINKDEKNNGNIVRVVAIASNIRMFYDKHKKPMAVVTIEDYTDKAVCLIRNKIYEKVKEYLKPDAVLLFIGISDMRDEELRLMADDILTLEDAVTKYAGGYILQIDSSAHNLQAVNDIYKLCTDKKSSSNLDFIVKDPESGLRRLFHADNVTIPMNIDVLDNLINIFGRNNVRLSDKKSL